MTKLNNIGLALEGGNRGYIIDKQGERKSVRMSHVTSNKEYIIYSVEIHTGVASDKVKTVFCGNLLRNGNPFGAFRYIDVNNMNVLNEL